MYQVGASNANVSTMKEKAFLNFYSICIISIELSTTVTFQRSTLQFECQGTIVAGRNIPRLNEILLTYPFTI